MALKNYNVPSDLFSAQLGIASTPVSGAAPQQVNGNDPGATPAPILLAEVGTLSARISYRITTNNLTFTAVWQVSLDGTTNWFKLVDHNTASQAAFATGTGSLVTGTVFVAAPMAVYAYPHMRCVVISGAASAAGGTADVISVLDYAWLRADHIGE